MGTESIVLLLGALGTFFVVIGGGAKWMLSHLDSKDKASALREAEARTELSLRLNQEIASLRADLVRVQSEKSVFLKRIYQLEFFIHQQPGISIPHMEGWPPT